MLSDEGFSSGISVASIIKRVVGYFVSKHTGMSLSICALDGGTSIALNLRHSRQRKLIMVVKIRNAKSEICKPSHNCNKHKNDSSIAFP